MNSTEDAITSAGVWHDDARVVACLSWKRLAELDETPGARIRIGSPSLNTEETTRG